MPSQHRWPSTGSSGSEDRAAVPFRSDPDNDSHIRCHCPCIPWCRGWQRRRARTRCVPVSAINEGPTALSADALKETSDLGWLRSDFPDLSGQCQIGSVKYFRDSPRGPVRRQTPKETCALPAQVRSLMALRLLRHHHRPQEVFQVPVAGGEGT
jgi:hypothetical protein